MSLPPQVNKAVKHPPAQRPPVHQSEVYYGLGPSLDPGLSDLSAGTSGMYNPEKAAPNLGLYQQQQPPQTKWMQQQDVSAEGTGWPQEAQWGQSFPSYTGGVNMRGFHHKEGLTMGALNQMQDVFRDNMQWEPMHQLQSYQHQQQQQQQHSQTFPAFPAFRQNKPQQPQFNPGYYTEFVQKQGPVPGMGYVETNKQQMHQIQQQQQQQMHLHQQQQQQQQQQLQMQQHCQQRQLQTQYHHQHIHINQPTMQQEVTPKLHFASFQSREQPETKIEAITDEPPQEQREEVVVKETLSESGGEGVLCSVPAAAAESAPNPRRSRRLSRDSVEQGQNGLGQGAPGGVIQSTRTQRRRASKEINLETLAQQAAQREALPPNAKEDVSSVPLVIPVSVPVPRLHQQGDTEGGWGSGRPRTSERCGGPSHKPSVIVARRRSLRNTVPERTAQKGEGDSGTDEEGKPRAKRRPRPEPLIIPPPRPSSFIPPSVYSSITPYQSHLRSPVHPLDHPVMLPPYTPPPILSPVRAGSGLYFSTFLSNMAAAGTQVLPPPPTKSVSVSLLRLASSEITPPQAVVTDATPVSLEPRINVGHQYQAGIPELLGPGASQLDQHRADLLWLPLETEIKHGGHDSVRDLMKLSCSSVLKGGGTNQELLLHCLFQSGGDVLKTLERLMLQDVLFPKGHPLSNYHYSGSDFWTAEEKRYFNKGISAYRKDFIMVQKLVQTKTVAQCVEFYYTYKKQVKVGRSGALTFGPADLVQHSHEELIDNKSSLRVDQSQAELNHQPEPSKPSVESLHQSLQAHDYAASRIDPEPVMSQPLRRPSPPPRPLSEPQAKTAKAPPKPAADPDQVFPCKKCDRVFYKVKSRSAHMKSHAEQEKKAAALRLKQQEEQARMRTLPEPGSRMGPRRAEDRAHASGLYREQGSGSSEADDAEDEDWH